MKPVVGAPRPAVAPRRYPRTPRSTRPSHSRDRPSSRSRLRQAEEPGGVFLEHDVELAIGKPAAAHGRGKGTRPRRCTVLARPALGPEFRDEAVFRPKRANRVGA